MTVVPDAWLTAAMGRPSFAVHAANAQPADVVQALGAHEAPARAFYFAKVPALELEMVKALEGAGFAVVETSLQFQRPIASGSRPPVPNGVTVSACEPRWKSAVLDIAEHAFRYSRFHVDSCVGHDTANDVKRQWIESYVEGRRGDALLVAHQDDRVLGFNAMLVAERPDHAAAVIDLIAVAPGDQQRGIGGVMIEAAARQYQSRCASLEVGTQAANIPSVRLYERLGFRLVRSQFVLHRHVL